MNPRSRSYRDDYYDDDYHHDLGDGDDGPDYRQALNAHDARDIALGVVAENSGAWFPRACEAVAKLSNWEGTGEDLRLLIAPVIGEPHKPNAWGALINTAIKRKYLFRTGERRHMVTVRSHARMTDVYRSR